MEGVIDGGRERGREEVAEERGGRRCSRALRGGRECSLVSRGELERGKRMGDSRKTQHKVNQQHTCSTSNNKGHPPVDSHLDFHTDSF